MEQKIVKTSPQSHEPVHSLVSGPTATAKHNALWTSGFALLCLAQFLGYSHNAILLPTIPLYVTSLDGSAFMVGMVVASFSVMSVVIRPFVGYWTDTWSDSGMQIAGLLVLGGGILIGLFPFVGTTMIANALRGIGWAGLNTGGYVLLARIAPISRRGEASGYYGGAQASAHIFFPAMALWLIHAPLGGFPVVMISSTALAVVGAGIGFVLARQMTQPARTPSTEGSITKRTGFFSMVEQEVLLEALVLFFVFLPHPAVTSFLVVYAKEIGIENFGWYFVVVGATSLLSRPVLGHFSDRAGRGVSLAAGFVLEILSLSLLVVVTTLPMMLVSGVLFGLGVALGTATSMALAMQRADPQRRGRAMATFSTAFPLSVAIGSLLSGSAVQLAGYPSMFGMIALLECAGLLVVLANWSRVK